MYLAPNQARRTLVLTFLIALATYPFRCNLGLLRFRLGLAKLMQCIQVTFAVDIAKVLVKLTAICFLLPEKKLLHFKNY